MILFRIWFSGARFFPYSHPVFLVNCLRDSNGSSLVLKRGLAVFLKASQFDTFAKLFQILLKLYSIRLGSVTEFLNETSDLVTLTVCTDEAE